MFSIAEVQTKVINYNGTNKSCILQIVHTKAIAALTQFYDFFLLEHLYTVSEERKWFQAQQSLLYQAQQSLLYQAQQGLLYQAQQGLPNWPTNYKNAFATCILEQSQIKTSQSWDFPSYEFLPPSPLQYGTKVQFTTECIVTCTKMEQKYSRAHNLPQWRTHCIVAQTSPRKEKVYSFFY